MVVFLPWKIHYPPGHHGTGHAVLSATALRPALLVVAGLVVVAAVAGLALRDRSSVLAPPQAVSPQAAMHPEISAPAPPIEKPTFDVVRINPQGNAVMAGHAAPGSDVTITDAGKVVGHAQADQHGDWVFVPPTRCRLVRASSAWRNGRPTAARRQATARYCWSCQRPPLVPPRTRPRRWPC